MRGHTPRDRLMRHPPDSTRVRPFPGRPKIRPQAARPEGYRPGRISEMTTAHPGGTLEAERLPDHARLPEDPVMTDASLPFGSDRPASVPVHAPQPVPQPPTLGPIADTRRLIESFGISHTGNVRKVNEDHFVTAALQRAVQIRQTNL